MKIFLCLKYYLPEVIAGTEIYVAALAKCLQNEGHQVSVIKPGYSKDGVGGYQFEGINVLEYPGDILTSRELIRGKKAPAGIHYFKKLLEEEKPDLIHF